MFWRTTVEIAVVLFLANMKKARYELCGICEINCDSLSKVHNCAIINIEKVPPIDGCPFRMLLKITANLPGLGGYFFA